MPAQNKYVNEEISSDDRTILARIISKPDLEWFWLCKQCVTIAVTIWNLYNKLSNTLNLI
jgi:hypothetical protein